MLQQVVGSNPARVACEGFFPTDSRKALSIQRYTHVCVGQKCNQLFITRRKN